jgi:alpha-D-ribose 1-methylphosphonate 5-phosphate C-P lyase
MMPKSGCRFSEKIMLQSKTQSGMVMRRKIVPLPAGWGTGGMNFTRSAARPVSRK